MLLLVRLLACLLVRTLILIDIFFAVNELQGYFVITAFDSDNKSILILSYLILDCPTTNANICHQLPLWGF